MKKTDVLIVGAGPAGSVCGYLLKKAGMDCIVIDHATFPRDKICGGGLTSKCFHLLERLMPDFTYDFNPVSHIRIDVDGKAHCEFDIKEPIRIVQRKVFDHQLLQHFIQAGGNFCKGALMSFEQQDNMVIATLKSGEQIACKWLVGADGSNSRVRRCLNPDDSGIKILPLEQYVDKKPGNAIEVAISSSYDVGGYFYRFPNDANDVVGFGDYSTTFEKFRNILRERSIPEERFRGAYIYLSNDYPLKDNVILIGDAGGFANRTTCEGLYDAFLTARNASTAIIENRSFREINAHVFQKMKKQMRVNRILFSKPAILILRWMCRYPALIRWLLDTKMQRESWIK